MNEAKISIFKCIRREFAKQPLTLIFQFLTLIIAIPPLAVFFGWISVPQLPNVNVMADDVSAVALALALMLLLSSIAALIAKQVYLMSSVGGFCISILLSIFVVAVTMLPVRHLLMLSATNSNGRLASPMIDLIYWGIVIIFFGINAETIAKDWARSTIEGDSSEGEAINDGSKGAFLIGILLLGSLFWGYALSSGQQKLVQLIVTPNISNFERH
ncbi:hypothetical protein [Pseudonocardia sp. TMWB2A]|uniref:hypothetical protein n=1 Tax=Pseudonocardia sp. TMWB2A TaxID=687430 RepID=UPI00307DC946